MKRLYVLIYVIIIFLLLQSAAISGFQCCPGDFDGDGDVDALDLTTFADNYGLVECDYNSNIKYICSDDTIQSVIDSIADASENMPYTILIPSGVYDCTGQDLVMKEWVHLRGFGPGATIIETANGNNIIAISHSSINNLGIKYSGSGEAAITKSGLIRDFVLNQVEFNIYGGNAAISFSSGGDFLVFMYNVKIITEGKGLYIKTAGCYYLHDVDIFLTGNNIGASHIGIQIDGYSRFYIWGSKIGTGYGYPGVINDTDQDIIGLYVPVENTSPTRIEVHDLESFCRNDGAQEGVKVNVIRAEAGWFRCFGCFGQAETPPDWGRGKTLYQSGNGKIEVSGCRFSRYEGNIFGSPQRGVSQYTTADDQHALDKFEGGLILLDATDGAFTLKLPYGVRSGDEYIFKKIDSSANVITIDGYNHMIDGQASVSLSSQYETVRIIGGATEWCTY